MAHGGEKDNGDNLICIEDRKVAIAYAIEALRLFDHFHFRVRMQESDAPETIRLAKPPAPGEKPWFAQYYRIGHVRERLTASCSSPDERIPGWCWTVVRKRANGGYPFARFCLGPP